MNTTLLLLMVGSQSSMTHGSTAGALNPTDLYPYRSSSFNQFIADSYSSIGGSQKFYSWFEGAYRKSHFQFPDKHSLSLRKYLQFKYKELAATRDPAVRTAKERTFAASLHRLIKKTLPTFSLEAGFEFRNAATHGQRQCLQSVLLAGLLQKGGVRAGVAMVNRNIEGQETNNKHAVAVARLADGHDLIVDASEDAPFAKQLGLFVDSTNGYKFVRPIYAADMTITSYALDSGASSLTVGSMRPLPRSFIRSQFDYYRGERTVGGVMAKDKTPAGLALASKYLGRSVDEEPQNPLAEYMLGRVELYRGNKVTAAKILGRAMMIYSRQGWIPPDERMALSQAEKNS